MKIECNEIFIGEDEQRNERTDDFFSATKKYKRIIKQKIIKSDM